MSCNLTESIDEELRIIPMTYAEEMLENLIEEYEEMELDAQFLANNILKKYC